MAVMEQPTAIVVWQRLMELLIILLEVVKVMIPMKLLRFMDVQKVLRLITMKTQPMMMVVVSI